MIYLQAHELFIENISRKCAFHGNGHTFQYFLLLSRSRLNETIPFISPNTKLSVN